MTLFLLVSGLYFFYYLNISRIADIILSVMGWKIIDKYHLLSQYPKSVIVVLHTSAFDGVLVNLVCASYNKTLYNIVKHYYPLKLVSLFLNPLYQPIPLKKSETFNDIISLGKYQRNFLLGIAPEGTRKYTKNWKSGWYNIAKRLDCPVMICGLDYSKKEIVIDSIVYMTNHYSTDLNFIQSRLVKYIPRYPQNCSLF